jgi:hypothetical protein
MKEDLNDCSWPKADVRECLLRPLPVLAQA